MVKAKEDDSRPADIIKNWIRTRSTIEFLGVWESIYNPDFKVVEFDHFKSEAGLPTFTMSVSNWVKKPQQLVFFQNQVETAAPMRIKILPLNLAEQLAQYLSYTY